MATASLAKGAFVYFGPGGPIKIGYSVSVEQRLAMLRTDNHLELELLASIGVSSIDEARDMESTLHANLSDLRIRGEWFAFDARITDVIEALKRAAEAISNKGGVAIDEQPVLGCSVDQDALVVEWSHSQGRSHIHTMELIDLNRDVLFTGRGEPTDYAVIGVFSSHEEADAFADAIEPKLCAARLARQCRGKK